MCLKVEYLRETNQQSFECWSFTPLTTDVAHAMDEARDAQSAALTYFGATCFRVVDDEGNVMATEPITSRPLWESRTDFKNC
jgi:hypothetical protein